MIEKGEQYTDAYEVTSNTTSLIELAEDLGVRKQTVFKIAKRLGIEQIKLRDSGRGNQHIAFVSEGGAAAILEEYKRTCRGRGSDRGLATQFGPDTGWFYVIELEPVHDPGRFKAGFTTDVDDRLRKHRCSAPFATYRRLWPCKRIWERTAMDCLALDTTQLHTEVYRTGVIEQVLARGDKFFELMPSVEAVAIPEPEEIVT